MEEVKKLYVDMPSWGSINVDDFVVTIGKNKSNSVYHVVEVNSKPRKNKRITRHYLKVYKSDLITCLRRDLEQKLIPMVWYSRK